MAIKIDNTAVTDIIYDDNGTQGVVYKVIKDGSPVWCKKYYLDFSFVKSSTPASGTSYVGAFTNIFQKTTDEPSDKLNPYTPALNKFLAYASSDLTVYSNDIYFDDVLRIDIYDTDTRNYASATYDNSAITFTPVAGSNRKEALITVKNAASHSIVITDGSLKVYHFKLYNDTAHSYYIKNWTTFDKTINFGDRLTIDSSTANSIEVHIEHLQDGTSEYAVLTPPDEDTYNSYSFSYNNLKFLYRSADDTAGSTIESPAIFNDASKYICLTGVNVVATGLTKTLSFSTSGSSSYASWSGTIDVMSGDRMTATTHGIKVYVGSTSAVRATKNLTYDAKDIASFTSVMSTIYGLIPVDGSGSYYEITTNQTVDAEISNVVFVAYPVYFSETTSTGQNGSWDSSTTYNARNERYVYVTWNSSTKTVTVELNSSLNTRTFTLNSTSSAYTYSMSGVTINGTSISANTRYTYQMGADYNTSLMIKPVTSRTTRSYTGVFRAVYRTGSSTTVVASKSATVPYGTVINSDSSQVASYFKSNNDNSPVCWYPTDNINAAYYDPEYYDATVTSSTNYDIINYQSFGIFTFGNAQFYQYDYQQDLWQASCVITNAGNAAISIISVYFFEFQASTGGSDSLISKTTVRNLAAGASYTFISNDYLGRGYKSAHIVAYITYATRTSRDTPSLSFNIAKQTDTIVYGPYDRSTNLADYIHDYDFDYDADYLGCWLIIQPALPVTVSVILSNSSWVQTSSTEYVGSEITDMISFTSYINQGTSGEIYILDGYFGVEVIDLSIDITLSAPGYTSVTKHFGY